MVVVGSIDVKLGKKYGVSEMIPHQKYFYNNTHLYNDIGLLKTSEKIIFNKNVQPIKLSPRYIDKNEQAVACGFGDTENGPPKVLLYVDLKTLNYQTCKEQLPFNQTQTL